MLYAWSLPGQSTQPAKLEPYFKAPQTQVMIYNQQRKGPVAGQLGLTEAQMRVPEV